MQWYKKTKLPPYMLLWWKRVGYKFDLQEQNFLSLNNTNAVFYIVFHETSITLRSYS